MTKLRTPLTVEASIHFAISQDPKGLEIPTETGKSLSWFRQCADTDNDGSNIALKNAAELSAWLISKGGYSPFLAAFAAEIDRLITAKGDGSAHDPLDPVERLAEIMAAGGDLAREVHSAGADKEYTAAEKAAIGKLINEGHRLLDAIARDVEEASKVVPIAS